MANVIFIVYCPKCGHKNRFGTADPWSFEETDGTDFVCCACGCTTLTLWQFLHTSIPLRPLEQTSRLCPSCSTWYAIGYEPDFCLACGNCFREPKQRNCLSVNTEYLQGDIFAQSCDFVVVSANNWLAAGSGTAKAAVQQGGVTVRNWIATTQSHQCPLKIGTAVLSPSGDLSSRACTHLVFAISLGYRHFANNIASGRILATPESVRSATLAALKLAVECDARRIALPLMGGRKGYSTVEDNPAHVMLATMFRAIAERSAELQNKHIIVTGPPWLNQTAKF